MNINKALADAISKGASKITRKPVAGLRRDVALLKRELASLRRQIKLLQKPVQAAQKPDTQEAGLPKLRPTSKAVLGVRNKLGLTQAQLAKLIGVSTLTVSKWETAGGRVRMRGKAMAGFARVRGMGKREAKAALETASSGK